ncbi:MAG: hypothetical protein MUE40_20670 [Anaerolineae bacterium]|jgi:hypothetical protein|nr:hypothetical protein [Anaerolineae bacterium]
MPVNTTWADASQTILIHHYSGRWTWDEYHQSIQTTHTLLAGVDHPVHLIIDLTEGRLIPAGSFIEHLRGEGKRLPEQVGTIVLAGSGLMFKVIQRVMATLPQRSGRHVVMVDTLAQARQHLAQVPAGDTVS